MMEPAAASDPMLSQGTRASVSAENHTLFSARCRGDTAGTLARWILSACVVVGLHAGAVWVALRWQDARAAAGSAPPAVLIDLAPPIAAPEPPPEAPPQPAEAPPPEPETPAPVPPDPPPDVQPAPEPPPEPTPPEPIPAWSRPRRVRAACPSLPCPSLPWPRSLSSIRRRSLPRGRRRPKRRRSLHRRRRPPERIPHPGSGGSRRLRPGPS